jgi:hypothetical protein
MSLYSAEGWYRVRCDYCPRILGRYGSSTGAFLAAYHHGWEWEDGKHTCPACVRAKQKKQQEVVKS